MTAEDGFTSDTSDATPYAGRIVFEKFRILERIAGGGMAEIFKVERTADKAGPFALKLIRSDYSDDTSFQRMLIDEAKIASQLAHPHIARVLEFHDENNELGLIIEYVDGIDLVRAQKVLREKKTRLSLPAAVLVLRDLLEGLDFAHRAKDAEGESLHLVHRDVSPGNVMIDVEGRIRIVDWGIARAKKRLAETEAGHVKGKFRYMAPEQILGLSVGPYTDVYASAMTFWELLAESRIYDDVEMPELMTRVSNADVPSLEKARANVPRSLSALYARATAKDPQKRFHSAREFIEAIDALAIITDDARTELRRVVAEARITDRKRSLSRAIARLRASLPGIDLERALLRALESPDRVVDMDAGRPLVFADA